MPEQPVILSIDKTIATLTLNRPDLRNAFDDQMVMHFMNALQKVQKATEVQIVVLKGAGKDFCAGANIQWMRHMADAPIPENHQDAMELAKLFHFLQHLNKITIAIIQGAVFGGGLGLAACCDIAIASLDAKFCFAEAKLGLIPSVISPYILSSMGLRAAKRYMLTAEIFDAETAKNLNLIHEVVEGDALEIKLQALIAVLQENGPQALIAIKHLLSVLTEQEHKTPLDQMAYTADLIAHIRTTKEAKEGLSAFIEKRKPVWLINDISE